MSLGTGQGSQVLLAIICWGWRRGLTQLSLQGRAAPAPQPQAPAPGAPARGPGAGAQHCGAKARVGATTRGGATLPAGNRAGSPRLHPTAAPSPGGAQSPLWSHSCKLSQFPGPSGAQQPAPWHCTRAQGSGALAMAPALAPELDKHPGDQRDVSPAHPVGLHYPDPAASMHPQSPSPYRMPLLFHRPPEQPALPSTCPSPLL